jgi:hypothetical protein
MKRAVIREAAVFLLFLALAILMTWPLATHLATASADDVLLNAWILEWDYHAIIHRLPLFEANMFWPAHLSLAYSEHLFGLELLAFPLFVAGLPPLTIHNVLLLLGFAASGYCMYALARAVTESTAAAIVAGTAFAFVGMRFHHLAHLQYVWSAWLPIVLLASLGVLRAPGFRTSCGLAAALTINGLTSLHWLLFGTTAAAVTLIVMGLWSRGIRDRRFWLATASAFATAGLILLPFAIPYFKVAEMYGMLRSRAEVAANGARWHDWLVPNLQNRLYRAYASADTYRHERSLFPGVIAFCLAGAGLVAAVRRRDLRSVLAAALIWLVIGALGARGLNGYLHSFLYEHVTAFRGIRMPARWVMIAYVGLDLLVALGVKSIIDRLHPRWARVVTGFIVAAFLFELRAAPIRYFLQPTEERPVYEWLAGARIAGGVMEIPMTQSDAYVDLLYATRHHQRLMNGVSGYAPPHYRSLQAAYDETPPGDAFMHQLETLGCSVVVVHGDELAFRGDAVRSWLKQELAAKRLRFVRRFDGRIRGDYVFALAGTEFSQTPTTADEAALDRFLAGAYTYSTLPFEHVEFGPTSETIRGKLHVRGWAFAPAGVATVNLLFDNGRVIVRADREPRSDIQTLIPWYPNDPFPGFTKSFDSPPVSIHGDTDMQIEIIDERGTRVRGVPFWFRWLPPAPPVTWNASSVAGLMDRLGIASSDRERIFNGGAAIHDFTGPVLTDREEEDDSAFVDRVLTTLLGAIDPLVEKELIGTLRRGVSRERVIDEVLTSRQFHVRYVQSGTILTD